MKDKSFNKKVINNYNQFNYNEKYFIRKLCNKNYEKIFNELYPRLNKIHNIKWGKKIMESFDWSLVAKIYLYFN